MFDIISDMISHQWITAGGDQQYIYNICGAVIIILLVVLIDLVYRLFRSVWR